jgi:hypothetical protein
MFAGLTVTGHEWPDRIILLAALVTALGVLWRKVLIPMGQGFRAFVRAIGTFERIAPVLITIGEQFQANGGSSLRDSIDRIEAAQTADHEYTHRWRHDLSNEITKLGLADEVVMARLDVLAASDTVKIRKLDEIAAATAAGDVQMAEHRESEPGGRSA